MKVFIAAVTLTFLWSCNDTSSFRPQLASRIKILCSETELGNNDAASLAFLRDSCTREELVQLVSYKDPLVRVLSYRALVNRNEPGFFELLKNHLSDTVKLTWWYYDDACGIFTVADLMTRKALRKLDRAQKDTLIELVLLRHPYLDVADWMIQEIKPDPKYYSIIKSRAGSQSDRCGIPKGACYALAKFKKQEDIGMLKEKFASLDDGCFEWTFKAIEVFPDTSFYPILVAYFESNIRKNKQSGSDDLKYFCRALAQYKTPGSLSILRALTKKETYPDSWYLSGNKEFVFQSVYKYYTPLYKHIYEELKPQMSEFVMEYLDKPDYTENTNW
jgi:hypothetical protein